MKEPAPQRVAPPFTGEPNLAVGIILPEDERTRCEFSPTHTHYTVVLGNEVLQLAPGTLAEVVLEGQALRVTCNGRSVIGSPGAAAFITAALTGANGPSAATPLKPKEGLTVRNIVAGRSFHWRKEIEQILPGSFEVHAESGHIVLVNKLSFEDYCACVIASEMSPECPASFAQAQATAARSWGYVFLRNKHPGEKFQICNDDDCQRYQGTTHLTQAAIDAVRKSSGYFLVDESGMVCPAYYSKSCGGYLEEAKHSFGFSIPELSSHADNPSGNKFDLTSDAHLKEWIATPPADSFCSPKSLPEKTLRKYLGAVDEQGSYFRWSHRLSRQELSALVRERTVNAEVAEVLDLDYGARGTSGRLTSLSVRFLDQAGKEKSLSLTSQYSIRRTLHYSFLFSSAFVHRWEKGNRASEDTLVLDGAGWGHGVGLCQIGAVGMALKGYSFEQILKNYFPGCELKRAYE